MSKNTELIRNIINWWFPNRGVEKPQKPRKPRKPTWEEEQEKEVFNIGRWTITSVPAKPQTKLMKTIIYTIAYLIPALVCCLAIKPLYWPIDRQPEGLFIGLGLLSLAYIIYRISITTLRD